MYVEILLSWPLNDSISFVFLVGNNLFQTIGTHSHVDFVLWSDKANPMYHIKVTYLSKILNVAYKSKLFKQHWFLLALKQVPPSKLLANELALSSDWLEGIEITDPKNCCVVDARSARNWSSNIRLPGWLIKPTKAFGSDNGHVHLYHFSHFFGTISKLLGVIPQSLRNIDQMTYSDLTHISLKRDLSFIGAFLLGHSKVY